MTRHYFSGDAEAMGVTQRQIQNWDETGLVQPVEKRARRRIYDRDSFRRLLLVAELSTKGMSQKARRILPAITLPERDCWLVTDGDGFNVVETEPGRALSTAMACKRRVVVVAVPLEPLKESK
jgi:hypothetical protein